MSYPLINDEKYLEKIAKKKEFAAIGDKSIIPLHTSAHGIRCLQPLLSNHLIYHPYQVLAERYTSRNWKSPIVLLKWPPGIGKTIGSIYPAVKFLQSQYNDNIYNKELGKTIQEGWVTVIGFTSHTFRKDLMKYPELGFITREELAEFAQIQQNILRDVPNAEEKRREFISMISRRFNNMQTPIGRFRFYGYKSLLSLIFRPNPEHYSIYAELIDSFGSNSNIENVNDNIVKNSKPSFNIYMMSEADIMREIAEKKILINEELINSFKNGMIICDEIHHSYNSQNINNWGVALKVLFSYKEALNMRIIIMSATPVNTPEEIIDVINLLVPKEELPDGKYMQRIDLFDGSGDGKLRPGALQKITKLLRGKVSFLQDPAVDRYPTVEYMGVPIKNIPMLKFIRCKMTKLQQYTYESINNKALSQDAQYLNDFILPSPGKYNVMYNLPNDAGMFQTSHVEAELSAASVEWKTKHKISIRNGFITGDALRQPHLGNVISQKYGKFVDIMRDIAQNRRGKTFVYHPFIRMSGVNFIGEVLRMNGFIEYGDNPVSETICYKCGDIYENHKNSGNKSKNGGKSCNVFTASSFVLAHGEMDDSYLAKIISLVNLPENLYGDNILVLVGSRKLRESFDTNGMKNQMILSRPNTIPELIQIVGRVRRSGALNGYPKAERNIRIYIFVSSIAGGKLSYEESMYKRKMDLYKVVQEIDRAINIAAYDNIFYASDINKVADADYKKKSLGVLPLPEPPKVNLASDVSTYNILYAEDEVHRLIRIIKRLFVEISSVWLYEDIVNYVKSNDLDSMSSKYFSEDAIKIALHRLTQATKKIKDSTLNAPTIDELLDPYEMIVAIPGESYAKIKIIGKYYILTPIDADNNEILDVDIPYRILCEKPQSNIIDLDEVWGSSKNIKISQLDLKNNEDIETYDNVLLKLNGSEQDMIIAEAIETIHKRFDMTTALIICYYHLFGLIFWDNFESFENIENANDIENGKFSENSKFSKDVNTGIKWLPDSSKNYVYKLVSWLKENNNRKNVRGYVTYSGGCLEYKEIWNNCSKEDTNSKWFDEIEENDLIIGYMDRKSNSIFKIRNPRQKQIKYTDERKVEKGSACGPQSKNFLIAIAKKIGLDIEDNSNVLCSMIRKRLIYKDLENGGKLKYYYINPK
jgi:hypothetical protein